MDSETTLANPLEICAHDCWKPICPYRIGGVDRNNQVAQAVLNDKSIDPRSRAIIR